MRFSVIIPLEFHRGQIEPCLERWARQQTFPGEQFEILAAGCRSSLDEETACSVWQRLRAHDRLLVFDEPHDVSLCVRGAKEARGELLFFTESHCLPEPDILTLIDDAFKRHPEWAGLSCQSVPVTPNRLSVIEADMYAADIQYGMLEHPWRKILDQCFAVRAAAYSDAGGFRPELGHFAEWHLAAHMHRKGYRIGYLPEARVHHHYSGDIGELLNFTRDFAQGEMRYFAAFREDECRAYFSEPAEWLIHHLWDPRLSRLALRLRRNARSRTMLKRMSPDERVARIQVFFAMRYLHASTALSLLSAVLRAQMHVLMLRLSAGLVPGKSAMRFFFLKTIGSMVNVERMRFIRAMKRETAFRTAAARSPMASMSWSMGDACAFPHCGYYACEEWQGRKFRWSAPVAVMELPLLPGKHELTLESLPIRTVSNLRFYIDGRPVAAAQKGNLFELQFEVPSDTPVSFALTCEPWRVADERRLLGLPVTLIASRRCAERS